MFCEHARQHWQYIVNRTLLHDAALHLRSMRQQHMILN
jgi:hypothetical protein